MSKRKPVRKGLKLRATVVAIEHVRGAAGHTLVMGTSAAGRTSYDLLRMSEHELHQVRKKSADGERDAGDEAWA